MTVAYASDAVMDAFNASRGAHAKVRVQYSHRAALQEQIRTAQANGTPQSAPDSGTTMGAQRKLDDALESADAADEALIKVIRYELRSKPEAALSPVALPAP
jgi:hypothetical protein